MTKSISTAIAALLLIAMIALACGGETGSAPAEDSADTAERTATESTPVEPDASGPADEPEDLPEEEDEAPEEEEAAPAPAAPERIRFKRGESQGRISLNLAPNESRKYVVGVGPAQYFHIGIDDYRPMITIPGTRMLSELEEGDNYVSAVTTMTGDVVFEISNPTRGSVRTFALITIKHQDPVDH